MGGVKQSKCFSQEVLHHLLSFIIEIALAKSNRDLHHVLGHNSTQRSSEGQVILAAPCCRASKQRMQVFSSSRRLPSPLTHPRPGTLRHPKDNLQRLVEAFHLGLHDYSVITPYSKSTHFDRVQKRFRLHPYNR